jgi:hypothetical protein
MTKLSIAVAGPSEQFEKHLSLNGNLRLIFSGVFGSGKTWFLNHFFNEKHSDKYFTIRLAPVNYSVANNEDIFELIKFDILFELLKKRIESKETSDDRDFLLKHIFLLDPEKGIKGLFEKANLTNHDLNEILNNVNKLLDGDSNPTFNPSSPIYFELGQFLIKHTNETVGKIYEQNLLTRILYYLISVQKKETVLIIDDLDRIDPEHIFRILNVFSAHLDIDSNSVNKFGFKRIILVCDHKNIRNIFSTRYGQSTDFNGYIDKFYSRGIFSFENSMPLLSKLDDIIFELLPKDEQTKNIFNLRDYNGSVRLLVKFIFTKFIKLGLVNIRVIFKLIEHKDYYIEAKRFETQSKEFISYQFIPSMVFHFFCNILGGYEQFHSNLQVCIEQKAGKVRENHREDEYQHFMNLLLPILVIDNTEVTQYQSPYEDILCTFAVKEDSPRNNRLFWAEGLKIVKTIDTNQKGTIEDIFPYLLESVEILQKMGVLR